MLVKTVTPETGSWIAATTVGALGFFGGSAFFLRATFFAPARKASHVGRIEPSALINAARLASARQL
jgi:hypothetical protein